MLLRVVVRYKTNGAKGIVVMLSRSALEALLVSERTGVRETCDEGMVIRRQREETAPCEHAFLSQTLPPVDPTVQAIERRRSGSERE